MLKKLSKIEKALGELTEHCYLLKLHLYKDTSNSVKNVNYVNPFHAIICVIQIQIVSVE